MDSDSRKSAEQVIGVLACIDLGSKPARLATPPGPGERRVLWMPVGLRRGRPLALRFLQCRKFGESEAEVLGEQLDLFAGLRLLARFEGGNRLGDGLLQIPQLGERHGRQVEIRHRVLRLIQYRRRNRAEPARQETSGAGGSGRELGDPTPPFRVLSPWS